MFFDDYEGQLPKEGLRMLAALIAAANIAFTLYVLYFICRTYLHEAMTHVINRFQVRNIGPVLV